MAVKDQLHKDLVALRERHSRELAELLNKHNRDQNARTPDFILSEFLLNCLDAFDQAIRERKMFFAPGYAVNTQPNKGDAVNES